MAAQTMTSEEQTAAVKRIVESLAAAGEDQAEWFIDDPNDRGLFTVEFYLRRSD